MISPYSTYSTTLLTQQKSWKLQIKRNYKSPFRILLRKYIAQCDNLLDQQKNMNQSLSGITSQKAKAAVSLNL